MDSENNFNEEELDEQFNDESTNNIEPPSNQARPNNSIKNDIINKSRSFKNTKQQLSNNNKLSKMPKNNLTPKKNDEEKTEDNKNDLKDNKLTNKLSDGNNSKLNMAKKALDAAEKADEEGKNKQIAAGKAILKEKIKQKILLFVAAHLPIILIIIVVLMLLVLILSIILFFVGEEKQKEQQRIYGCSQISMTETVLSRNDFIDYVSASNASSLFKSNAGKIYDIAKKNNANPELVVIKAQLEGYSPGTGYNYWGIGCGNLTGGCRSYSSFDEGVLKFLENISRYPTLQDMVATYSFIGDNWYNPGGPGAGGCYYFEHIKEFMSESRAREVEGYCSPSRRCVTTQCPKTTQEDQDAYASWQAKRMVDVRESIFNIGSDECEDVGSSEAVEDDGTLGSQVASYAVETFDSYSYSQDRRFSAGYVDCSSMVFRAYSHFGYNFGGASTAASEYMWCKNNGKLVNASELKAGDLIFFNKGSHYAKNKAYNIGHVTMFIGNGNQFSARSSRYAQPDQVAVTRYLGDGTYFCRPYK